MMLMSLRNVIIELCDEKPLAFRNARGMLLECTRGAVWLTVEGQPGDFFLASGQRLLIEGDGRAVVQGLPAGAVRLVSESIDSIRGVRSFDRYRDRVAFLSRHARMVRPSANTLKL